MGRHIVFTCDVCGLEVKRDNAENAIMTGKQTGSGVQYPAVVCEECKLKKPDEIVDALAKVFKADKPGFEPNDFKFNEIAYDPATGVYSIKAAAKVAVGVLEGKE